MALFPISSILLIKQYFLGMKYSQLMNYMSNCPPAVNSIVPHCLDKLFHIESNFHNALFSIYKKTSLGNPFITSFYLNSIGMPLKRGICDFPQSS